MSNSTTTIMQSEKMKSIQSGIFDVLPLAIAVIPWGILCGSLSIEVGLTSTEAFLMSAIVFAGAAQLGGLALFPLGVGLFSIASTTFVISSRHMLYSASFRDDVKKYSFLKRIALAFFLTDEMFAVTESHRLKTGSFCFHYAISSGLTFYILWLLSTLVGIVLGERIDNLTELGLDFAIAATFIAMVVPTLKDMPRIVSAATAFILSVIFHKNSVPQPLLLASLIAMSLGYWLKKKELSQ